MSALTLTLRGTPAQRIDMSGITPNTLAGLGTRATGALPIHLGNGAQTLGDLFEVAGDDASDLHLTGETGRLDWIGTNMTGGRITVHGDAGRYLAAGLRGGTVRVEGSASDHAAAGLRGGRLFVEGDAGDRLGAALPADANGMRGGLVHVKGNAGARACDRMRRGTVVIGGGCGDFPGSRMIAGTLAVQGRIGTQPGYAMRRGTLLLAQPPERMPDTFADCGQHQITFLGLLRQRLAAQGIDLGPIAAGSGRVQRFAGDIAVGGKAEILVRAG